MSWLDRIFGSAAEQPTAAPGTDDALAIMRRLNPHAYPTRENGQCIFIEDHTDPDERMYRLEYQCAPDGASATAWVRHNPWGDNPYSAHQGHLFASGEICLGSRSFALEEAVQRARYWCAAYSYFRETGTFPNP